MIRLATRDDIPTLCDIARSFAADGDYRGPRQVLDWFHFASNLERTLDAPGGVIFVSEKAGRAAGFIAGLVMPSPYTAQIIALKTQWCVCPKRGRGTGVSLLRAFEKWARSNDATKILAASMSEAGEAVLDRLGFTAFETSFYKVL